MDIEKTKNKKKLIIKLLKKTIQSNQNKMNNSPLFSILIANYNNGQYLKKALQSVYSQTYKNWEIILVDDFSTDNSIELYKELENDSRIKIYYNDKNKGCGYTKHRCAELANGEICGFLDPDDALTNTALEESVEAHIVQPNASLVYSDCFWCDNNLNITDKKSWNHQLPNNTTLLEYDKLCVFHFATFKNNFYKRTLGISEETKRCVDFELFIKLEEVGELYFLPKKLYFYRFGATNSISNNNNGDKALTWQIIIKAEACKRRKLDTEKIVYPVLKDTIGYYVKKTEEKTKFKYLYPVYESAEFRLGKFLLSPLRWIKKIFGK